jgi:methylase of polypeptide subunit release factors
MKEALLTANQAVKSYSPNDIFFCPEESQFYSQCLEKMVLNRCNPLDSIIEFGAGDGSPVINCLLKMKFDGLIQGYELNQASSELALSRIEQYRLNQQYIIHNKCFFKHLPPKVDYLISNPPYLPAPDNDLHMPALHGGTDGAAISKQLLTLNCDHVLLMLSAYSNPIETVEHAIAHGYQLIDFMVSPLKFGYYSSEPKVKNAIAELRQNRKAFYSQNIYLLSGALFKKKAPSDVDLSTEFLQIMTAL